MSVCYENSESFDVGWETTVQAAPRFGDRVGLVAGGGRFPIHFAQAARARGIEVVCVAYSGHADAALADVVDRLYWTGIARLNRLIRCFKKEGIDCVVMAGKIQKKVMFSPWRIVRLWPDLRVIRLWLGRRGRDNKDDSLLVAFAEELRKDGIRLASALEVCPELLIPQGCPTRKQPTQSQRSDIQFGWQLAREMGRLDIGQSVVVKESVALAIEAIEGTDQAILRAGQLCPAGGFTVVKVAKPRQDMRFDVPTIGVGTVETLRTAGASVLAVEADKTILLDAKETIDLANRWGIAIVALTDAQVQASAA